MDDMNLYNNQEEYNENDDRDAVFEEVTGKIAHRSAKKHGFKTTLAKTAAIALVFGLVAGGAFTGVNKLGANAISVTEASKTAAATENKSSEITETKTGSETVARTTVVTGLTDVSDIAEATMPSIVAITNTGTVTYQDFWGQRSSYESSSCGSGIIIDRDDEYLYIATNNHVVSGAESLSVKFFDETVVDAETRGTYASGDLAVAMVKLSDIPDETLNSIKEITVGDSTALRVGEPTIAIGNALGYGQSVTAGIVSALGRSITTKDSTTGVTYTHDNLIQTDAAINPGNSGGALLNAYGELIGINSVKYSSTSVEGIGYAISMEDAYPIIQQLIETGSYMDTQTAYLGIAGADVTSDIAQTYNMPQGVYVSSVYDGSGAADAGLMSGDIITQVGDTEISGMDELKKALQDYTAGDTVRFVVYRQNNGGYKGYYVDITLMSAEEMQKVAQ